MARKLNITENISISIGDKVSVLMFDMDKGKLSANSFPCIITNITDTCSRKSYESIETITFDLTGTDWTIHNLPVLDLFRLCSGSLTILVPREKFPCFRENMSKENPDKDDQKIDPNLAFKVQKELSFSVK